MRVATIKTIFASALLVIMSATGWAGLSHLAPQAVVANSTGWTDLNNTLLDDGLFATCTGGPQFSQRWFRDSLLNSDALGIDTAENHITGVTIYVKGRSSNKRGKAQLQPYFGTTAGTASAALAMGTNLVTLTYDITGLRNDNPVWGGWRWRSLDSLNVQAAVRGNGLSFYLDYVFALVTYTSNVTGSNHYFVLTPSSVFDPETLGVAFQHTLTVHDVGTGLLIDTYNNTVALSDSTGALVPLTAEVINGTATIDFAIFDTTTIDGTSPQRSVIRISDGDTFLLTNAFQVVNGLYRYWFAPVSTPQIMGVPFAVSVSALNVFEDTVTAYSGTASLTAAAGLASPGNITFSGGLWSGAVSIAGAGEVWDSLRASSGARPAQGFSNAFYLQGDPNPYIIYTSPSDGSTNIPVNEPIVIVFSEAINTGTFAFTCEPDPGGWGQSWNSGNDTVSLTHNDFDFSTSYTFTVTSAQDSTGNNLASGTAPNPFSFTTGSSGLSGGPVKINPPRYFSLSGIHPNPAKMGTDISFTLPVESRVTIEIFNILGFKVATLLDARYPAGYHQAKWNGRNQSGQPAAAGVYLVRMSAGGFRATKKLMILR